MLDEKTRDGILAVEKTGTLEYLQRYSQITITRIQCFTAPMQFFRHSNSVKALKANNTEADKENIPVFVVEHIHPTVNRRLRLSQMSAAISWRYCLPSARLVCTVSCM